VGFFFACPGFFPFDPFLYCLILFFCPSCHFTFYATVLLQQTQHKHPYIRTHDPSKRAAEDPRLRPHGHWDRRDSNRGSSSR
jgi:hypothetical protein